MEGVADEGGEEGVGEEEGGEDEVGKVGGDGLEVFFEPRHGDWEVWRVREARCPRLSWE